MTTVAPRIVIRADGGATLGLGHIKRCEVLANELIGRGCQVTFLTAGDVFARDDLVQNGFNAQHIDAPDEPTQIAQTLEAIRNLQPHAVFLDIGDTQPHFIRAIKSLGPKVISMDDLGPGGAEVDALTGEDIGLLHDLLPEAAKQHPEKIFGGPEYSLIAPVYTQLREELFAELSTNSDNVPERFNNQRVLVLFGASDPHATTASVAETLTMDKEPFQADIVLGPCANHSETVIEVAHSDPRFALHRNPTYLPRLMAQSAIAITSVGQGLLQLTLLGTPCVAISQSQNLAQFADKFARRGSSIHLGQHNAFSPTELLQWRRKLMNDPTLWTQMSHAALETVDGKGAPRVADLILSLVK